MKIVIDIDEEIYKNIQSGNFWLDSGLSLSNAYDFIKNGTPLPRGHGRLIDADAMWDIYHSNDYDFYEALDDAPTILEADKENIK